MIGLDTNILLRWLVDTSLLSDDAPHQSELVQQAILDSSETFFINHVVLAEALWVLRNKAGQSKSVVTEVVQRLLRSINVQVDKREVVEAAAASFETEPGDFADHLIGHINRAAHCSTTLTFDRKAGKSRGLFTYLGNSKRR